MTFIAKYMRAEIQFLQQYIYGYTVDIVFAAKYTIKDTVFTAIYTVGQKTIPVFGYLQRLK